MKINDFKTIDDILDFAIEEEQKAVDLYTSLAANARNSASRLTFEDFIREEMYHKEKLMKMKNEKHFDLHPAKVQEMKLSDYTTKIKPSPEMTFGEALLYAMEKEKAAFKLYTHLAGKAQTPELKDVFKALAQEESNHKLHFEIEYDEHVLSED